MKPPDKNFIAFCGEVEFISPEFDYIGCMGALGKKKQILKKILEPENNYKN